MIMNILTGITICCFNTFLHIVFRYFNKSIRPETSIETANNVAKMARELGIKNVAAIANKITETAQINVIQSQFDKRYANTTCTTLFRIRVLQAGTGRCHSKHSQSPLGGGDFSDRCREIVVLPTAGDAPAGHDAGGVASALIDEGPDRFFAGA